MTGRGPFKMSESWWGKGITGDTYVDALWDGTIEENYNYLVMIKPVKSRYINHHLPRLKELAEKCDHITEFGVVGVNSTWALLAGKPKKMISVDPINDKAPKIQELALELAKKEGIDYKFIEDYSTNIEIDETDLLFIDSGHTYECLTEELKLHANKVKKYIVCHDIILNGIRHAMAEFLGIENVIDFLTSKEPFYKLQNEGNKDWIVIYETNESEGLIVLERKT